MGLTQPVSDEHGNTVDRSVANAMREILERPFGRHEIKHRPGAEGRTYSYVTGYSVIARLNEVFPDGWSFSIEDVHYTLGSDRTIGVLAVVEMVHRLRESGQDLADVLPSLAEIKNIQRAIGNEVAQCIRGNDIVGVRGTLHTPLGRFSDIGTDEGSGEDPPKAAATDCLKRCARQIGVALHLYDNTDDNGKPKTSHAAPRDTSADMATGAQIETLRAMAKDAGADVTGDGFSITVDGKQYGAEFGDLTKAKAAEWIDSFNRKAAGK